MRQKPYRSQGQVINNLFTLITVVVMSISMVIYVNYVPKPARVNSNLACQKITKTSDKILNEALLKEANTLLNQGFYVLDGGFIKPRFGKSYLKNIFTLEQTDELFSKHILKPSLQKNYFVTIKYEVIENDKNDPRKKEFEKKHAGSLMSSFRINGQEAFRMHTDFLQYDIEAIENRITCTIKAFRNNAK